ncbi:nuclear transport factor 2 family protein [Frigidibacter sp. RF13]|uniref:nuclear transport factor 2 family protein n=1 Tax=Frigidibacter sp. RF13 TaxID=2997340 RepID=UPI002271E6B4|nr:nuclear transport factor 2 family protein [Frigidibacter sp. RF13]MCY1126569.1 nuclear transport factor 2 family protein [Frigidibacter sp. RF13]
MTDQETVAAIVDVVHTYVTAMTAGDRPALERIFFEKASEVGHFDGELLWNSRDAFIRMCEEAASGAANVSWSIRSLAVHGDIAVAHVEDDWAGMRFDDLLTLVRHEGAWRIVSKVYRVQS